MDNEKKGAAESNKVILSGVLKTPFIFSHEMPGEKFYTAVLSVERTSKVADELPILIPDWLTDVQANVVGSAAKLIGEYRSFNEKQDGRNRLVLTVFARELEIFRPQEEEANINQITLDGFICRKPVYRKTPFGREVCDIMVAVNRRYGKSDYIPCICWGRNARFVLGMDTGNHVRLTGRIQSRAYTKKTETSTEQRTAYEVSVVSIEAVE